MTICFGVYSKNSSLDCTIYIFYNHRLLEKYQIYCILYSIGIYEIYHKMNVLFPLIWVYILLFYSNSLSSELSTQEIVLSRGSIILKQYPLLDQYDKNDPFSFSQKHYQLIWNSDARKFQKYSMNSKQLSNDVSLFFHSE